MRRRLPPFEQIEAFVEAAHAPSFRVAAERCALSPAAFSRRIQGFSSFLGVELFERRPGGVRLSAAGQDCLRELEPAYAELRRAAAAVAQRGRDEGKVRLSLSHSLAVGWLIPRLDDLRATHPNIELTLRTQRNAADVRRGEADLGICFTDIDTTGLTARPLVPVSAVPVATPDLAQEVAAKGGGLAGHRLLGVAAPTDVWAWWSQVTGYSEPVEAATNFDLTHAMYEAASQGLGIAMGSSPTVAPFLDVGRLVRLPLPVARLPAAYNLIAAADRRRRPAVAAVWRWLEAQAEATPSLA
jgi:DNA-binding transcriptional LysR family regulator